VRGLRGGTLRQAGGPSAGVKRGENVKRKFATAGVESRANVIEIVSHKWRYRAKNFLARGRKIFPRGSFTRDGATRREKKISLRELCTCGFLLC